MYISDNIHILHTCIYKNWQHCLLLPVLKRAKQKIVQIVLNDVLYHVRAHSATVSGRSLYMKQNRYSLFIDRIHV
jgi:hypothetical protein